MNQTTDNPTLQSEKLEPPDRIFVFKRSDGGNSWHYERLEESDVEYVRAPVVAPQGDALALKKLSSRIGDVIEESLRSYRCQYTRELPDLENGLALVDLLTPEPDKDVTRGLQELELLADYIASDVDDVIKEFAAASSPASSPVPPEQVQCADCLTWIDRNVIIVAANKSGTIKGAQSESRKDCNRIRIP